MEKKILQQLYKLKSIQPEESFTKRSRSLILAKTEPMVTIFAFPKIAWAGVFVAVLFIFTLGVIPQLGSGSLSSLNASNLDSEFKNLSINIQLKEISYQQTVDQAIASALTEIGENQAVHLNQSLLETESENATPEEFSNPQIDELLNQIIL